MRRGSLACAFGAALALLLALAWPAAADDADDEAARTTYRLTLDRAELSPAAIGGQRLHVFVSAMTLEGSWLELEPGTLEITAGASKLDEPATTGFYGATHGDLALVLVVQTSTGFEPVLPAIVEAIDTQLLAPLAGTPLGGRTQVALVSYGESLQAGKLAPLKAARSAITALAADGTAGEPVLMDAVEYAVKLLKKAKTDPVGRPLRKLILVVGDGRDLSADRERVTLAGERAARDSVRIHTLGFAPDDIRRPLLALGELSKRSAGTFRWVRLANSWGGRVSQVRDELLKQYVVTYFLPDDAVGGKKLSARLEGKLAAAGINEIKVPAASCNGTECPVGYCAADECNVSKPPQGRGVLGWILLIGGIGLGAAVLLGLVSFVLAKRARPVPYPLAPGQPLPPGGLPVPPAGKPKRAKRGKPRPVPVVALPVAVPGSVPPVGPGLAGASPVPVPAPPPAGPRFYVMSGPFAGREVPLFNGFTIGKVPESNLVIDDGYASSQHAQIGVDHHGNCRVYDRNSTNGTYVNGVRVNEYALEHGMTVRIGSTDLRFLAQ